MKPLTPQRMSAPKPSSKLALILMLCALSVTGCITPWKRPSPPSVPVVVTCPAPPKMPAPLEAQPSQPYLQTWNEKVRKWREQLEDTQPTR